MIIGLTGLKGSGKDTAGAYLVARYGFRRLSFAQPLKDSAAALFGIDPMEWETTKNDPNAIITYARTVQDTIRDVTRLTAREFLQRYGTEAHRDVFGRDFWTRQLFESLPEGYDDYNWVITDVRFENETRAVKEIGAGIVVQIDRPRMSEEDSHASEDLSSPELVDYVVVNDGTVDDLCGMLDALLIDQLGILPGGVLNEIEGVRV